jgi:hypothetical protein
MIEFDRTHEVHPKSRNGKTLRRGAVADAT